MYHFCRFPHFFYFYPYISYIMQKTQLSASDTVIRKFGKSYATWFQPSKSFVLLEEPAYQVYRMYTEGQPVNEIISFCTEKYGNLEGNIPGFTNDIIGLVQQFNNPENAVSVSVNPSRIKPLNGSSFRERTCKMGNKIITVRYQNEYLEFSLHPLFAHLEVAEKQKPEHLIELFENSRLYFFRYNGKVVNAFRKKDMEYFSGSVKQQIYSVIYGKDFNYWMMTFHASGVVQNGRAVLFSAAGGAGKSTISAMLKAHGYGYLSDDFIAAGKTGKVYPFPAAISVKEGAAKRLSELYPVLKETNLQVAFTGKKVKYLPVHNEAEIEAAPYPVKALVFVNYSHSAPFVFEEVEKREALQLLLKETWVNPVPENVSRFFAWIEETRFFRLQYSLPGQALEATQKLFS